MIEKQAKLILLIWALRLIALSYKYRLPYKFGTTQETKPYELAQDVLEFIGENLDQLPKPMDKIEAVEREFLEWSKGK